MRKLALLAPGLLLATSARADQALFTANIATDTVSIFAWGPETDWEHVLLAEVDVCAAPTRLALHALGWEAYVACRDDSSVWRVDTYSRQANPIATGTGVVKDVVADPDLRHVWVSNFHYGQVTRVDIDTGATDDVDVGFVPRRMAMTPGADFIYVGSDNTIGSPEGTLAELDTDALWSRTLLTFPDENVKGVGYANGWAYVGLDDGSVSRVVTVFVEDCEDEWSCITDELDIDGGPADFELDTVNDFMWMTLAWNSQIAPLTNWFLNAPFDFSGSGLGGLAYDPENAWMFVVGGNSDTVEAVHVIAAVIDAAPIQLDPGREPRDVVVTDEMPGLVDVAPAQLSLGPKLTKGISRVRNMSAKVQLATSVRGDGESFVVVDDCDGRTLAPYEECEIEVRCAPGGALRQAVIDIVPSAGRPALLELDCEPD